MSKRVGIYAGAFDPVHDGHIEVARTAIQHLELDKVVFIVEKRPWGDKTPAPYSDRQNMLDLALQDVPAMEQLFYDDEQFTLRKTLPKLEKQFKGYELYFVFGADVFMHMNEQQWPELPKLFKHNIVVFERNSISEAVIAAHAQTLGIAYAILPSPYPYHSSTEVRLRMQGKELLLPKAVAGYIDTHKLYSEVAK